MVGSIDITRLNLDELLGVVNLYPWYSGARMELCRRMAAIPDACREEQFKSAALYLPDRGLLCSLVSDAGEADYSDKDIQSLLKAYLQSSSESSSNTSEGPERQVFVVGGDYFTKEQYEKARRSTDNIFASFASKARAEKYQENEDAEFDLCTETLAQIYAEQGYPEEARKIYRRLSELQPSKAVWYATLMEKL